MGLIRDLGRGPTALDSVAFIYFIEEHPTFLGRVASLSGTVGTATIRGGIRYLPLPHPSGVSRWLNEPENVAAVGRAMAHLRDWVDELGI